MRIRFVYSMMLVGLVCAIGAAPVHCASEYEVKAAFIYQFTKFVDWPSGAFSGSGAPLIIGVVGNDPFGRALDNAVSGKDANGRTITLRRYSKISDLQFTHLLFISSSESKRLSSVFSKIAGQATLTVSDIGGFAKSGGVVELKTISGKVGFDVNVNVAKRSQLKISSKLLRLANSVIGQASISSAHRSGTGSPSRDVLSLWEYLVSYEGLLPSQEPETLRRLQPSAVSMLH